MPSLSVAGYSGMYVSHEPEIRYALDIKMVLFILEVYTMSISPSQNSPVSPGMPFEFPIELESTREFVSLKEVREAAGLLAKQVICKAYGCWLWLPKGPLLRTVPAPDSTCPPHLCSEPSACLPDIQLNLTSLTLTSTFLFKFLNDLLIFVSCVTVVVPACILCILYVCSACRDQKRTIEPMKLELQTVASHQVGSKN